MAGVIIPIGGSEDKTGDMSVLKRVLAEAPGNRVHIITTATEYPEDAKKRYEDAFALLGIQDIEVSYINSRAEANDEGLAQKIGEADVIFMSGGSQLRLTHMLGGTAVLKAIRQANDKGSVIAGTSAGAACMPGLMLYGGLVENSYKKGNLHAAAGFGFVPNAVIDTHFSQRGRLPRLFSMVSTSRATIGIGLDESYKKTFDCVGTYFDVLLFIQLGSAYS